MKLGVCISNEKPVLNKIPLNFLQKKINNSANDWSDKFISILEKLEIDYKKIYIDKDNWIDEIKSCDIILWKPKFMGTMSSSFFREKVFFIESFLGKRIFPNYETIWHFDSKVAQKYIFEILKIHTPKSFVSFDYNETIKLSNVIEYPIVLKRSNGAGSTNVNLIANKKQFRKAINKEFIYRRIISKLVNNEKDPFGYIYFQEFIKDNSKDLRINVIGDKYVSCFWRENRKDDFRASGSGLINYTDEIPKDVIEYCVKISKENNFDSMAYDILFKNGKFVIIEMSYGFVDKAFYNVPGYYEINENGEICNYVEKKTWPQELWIKWALSEKKNNDY